jgi:hypothetical protein
LFGFSPESFEQFIRATSIAVMGPGVTAFGDGPDGGREATFKGVVPYPFPPAQHWSGYGVVQAKCKTKSEGAEHDQKWALEALKSELEKFAAAQSRRTQPDYYVFATNVGLSSAINGGKDAAHKILASYSNRLRLKDFAIWDANQLAAFLDLHSQLRSRFAPQLISGDVLSEMLAYLHANVPSAARVICSYLERELRIDEASRLDQAGNRTDEQLRLASVFVDLLAAAQPAALGVEQHLEPGSQLQPGLMVELLSIGSRRLDPKSAFELESGTDKRDEVAATSVVVLGGPGSGKSTITQFLAQIHRAALLERQQGHLLEPLSREIVAEIRALAEAESLPWPATPRYPLRVDLNRFAKVLKDTKQNIRSFGAFLVETIRGDSDFSYENLLAWLSTSPILLILDGLDEVPTSSNRAEVISTIQDFLADARQAETDLFLLLTSRPQGYSGEFARHSFVTRYVMPLSRVRALRYVEKYAAARFGVSDPTKRREIVEKLTASSQNAVTAQLMSTPLQVTFMVTVVAARGEPGEDRWQLFNSYYRTIYDRERQKAVPPFDAILSRQQKTIDLLHHDIGFWLQLQGEIGGQSSASISIGLFETLVDAYLQDLGFELGDRRPLVNGIIELAQHRLVFLTSRVPGELSFDVRSLQEFMAAECLTSGNPDVVQLRLQAIAPALYWRNVLLFAAGKCFSDAHSRHLQDAVFVLCELLNTSSEPLLSRFLAGSELALEILESGIASQTPRYERLFVSTALDQLTKHGGIEQRQVIRAGERRLASVYRDSFGPSFREIIEQQLDRQHFSLSSPAWHVLIRLSDAGVVWAREVFENHWTNRSDTDAAEIIRHLSPDLAISRTVLPLLDGLARRLPADTFESELAFIMTSGRQYGSLPFVDSLRAFRFFGFHHQHVTLRCGINGLSEIKSLMVPGLDSKAELIAANEKLKGFLDLHSEWKAILPAFAFAASPSSETLANALESLAAEGVQLSSASIWPWPLASCLSFVSSQADLRELAAAVRAGELGGIDDWRAAEQRWIDHGADLPLVLRDSLPTRPFTKEIAKEGLPPFAISFSSQSIEMSHAEIATVLAAVRATEGLPIQRTLTVLLLYSAAASGGLLAHFSVDQALWLIERLNLSELDPAMIIDPDQDEEDLRPTEKWLQLLERAPLNFSNWYSEEILIETRALGPVIALAESKFLQTPSDTSSFEFLAEMCAVGWSIKTIPPVLLRPERFEVKREKAVAASLALASVGLSSADAKLLAKDVVNLRLESDDLFLIMHTAEAHLGREPVSEFVRALGDMRYADSQLSDLLFALRQKIQSSLPSRNSRSVLGLVPTLEAAVGSD